MIDEILALRNKVHRNDFRFNLPSSLWTSHYVSIEEFGPNNLIELRRNGVLRGYAAISISEAEHNKVLTIREICADEKETFSQLMELVTERGMEQNVDFIVWRRCQEAFEDVLLEKGALTFTETMIMVALMNPQVFLKPFSDRVDKGNVVKLNIEGSLPVSLRIGENNFTMEDATPTDFTISLDSLTFVKLFFGKTSFFKEWIKGKIKVSLRHYQTASRLFKIVRNQRWYVPSGDWC